MKGQYEVEGCQKLAKYGIYKTFPNGEKKWLHVCDGCEQEISAENFKRVGGYLTASELDDLQGMRGTSRIRG